MGANYLFTLSTSKRVAPTRPAIASMKCDGCPRPIGHLVECRVDGLGAIFRYQQLQLLAKLFPGLSALAFVLLTSCR